MINWQVEPTDKRLQGELRLPSDKSITHRAIMLGGIAAGETQVINPLLGEDAKATIAAMESLGVKIKIENNNLVITGCNNQPQNPTNEIDCGNAGTLIRLLAGAICGRNVSCTLVGDESLSKRPMKRIANPLNEMGANIEITENGTLPLIINPVNKLQSITYTLPTASAQIKSAILLAGLTAKGGASVIEPQVCRDHTEKILPCFGVNIRKENETITVDECNNLQATTINVPADISSAAFFIVAATIVPNSNVVLNDVGINSTRIGIIEILKRMGANIEISNQRMFNHEPVADLVITSAKLQGIEITANDVPGAIDELPVILIAASLAEGQTKLRGAKELRAKESDRLDAMVKLLTTLGINLTEYEDGLDLAGGTFSGGEINSFGDHRIAMTAAVAGLVAKEEIKIFDCQNVATSFPHFKDYASKIGWMIN